MSAKNKKIQLYLRRLIRELCGAPDVDINDALATAQLAHLGQRRRSGEEYIEHPKEVAQIVYNYYQDPVLCAAALLHDTLEDAVAQGNAESDEEMASLIAGSFGNPELGDDVLRLVRSLTHEKSTDYTSYLIDLAADPQALKVKLADVLHNLSSSPSEKQLLKYKTALEALRAEYGEPPAGISGAHWEALKNIVRLDERSEDMLEVFIRSVLREESIKTTRAADAKPVSDGGCATQSMLIMGEEYDLPKSSDSRFGMAPNLVQTCVESGEDLMLDIEALAELWANARRDASLTGKFFEDFANEAYGGSNLNLPGGEFPFADAHIDGVFYSVKGTGVDADEKGQKEGFEQSLSLIHI